MLITTKYAGPCSGCGKFLPSGEQAWYDGQTVRHPECVTTLGQAPPEPRTRLPLWRHQVAAYEHLYPLAGGMLALDMGTGKTATAIALLTAWQARRVLILAPLSVVEVWPRQFETHAADRWEVCVPRGTIKERAEHLRDGTHQVDRFAVVLNYDCVGSRDGSQAGRKLMETTLLNSRWDVLVCDEAHRLRSPSGVQSRFVSRLADRVPRRLALTGTPMAQTPLDIYGQMRALDKRVLGTSFVEFRSRYAVMGGFQNHQVVRFVNLEELEERLAPYLYRVKASEVLDLPPTLDAEVICTLNAKASTAYRDLEAEMVAEIEEGTITVGNALVKLLRLQQLTGGNLQLDEEGPLVNLDTGKREALIELLGDMDPGERVVCFAQFRADLAAIHEAARAAGRTSIELSGSRHEIAGVWEPKGETVLACQLQSGGLGVDLTAARYAVYFSLPFSLSNWSQSRARLHRPGQSRPVEYITLEGHLDDGKPTVDRRVRESLKRNGNVVEDVMQGLRRAQATSRV
jgi:SNF2 family DNA or RNA helicase